jgi:RNA polymerase sigma factor (TIGR02999 family)
MDRPEITQLLRDWRKGDEEAFAVLAPIVYGQLRDLAGHLFRRESAGHTLQPTALVNEALHQLIRADVDWQDRNHFFALAARMMRRILVNHAQAKRAAKRGGGALRVTLEDFGDTDRTGDDTDILALDTALRELSEFDARKADLVELHYFGGLTYPELADVAGIAESTVHQDLRTAKAWLRQRLA